ncbi:MAG: nickel-responsive transcriptional regulator NikR [Mesorhizobium sp.]|nr:nickel-responsive transcriptional regulator NikR [Mesorhizobium sp.]MBL8579900.1 nickel-responsive transcriptional regulator NikR [Mesorhizobium sp.]
MQRTTITLDEELATELDAFIGTGGASSRSEAIRDLIRAGLANRRQGSDSALCFGVVSYAVDQSVRKLASRIPQSRMNRHDQTVASLSVPLDHSTTIDVVVMRGRLGDISSYAEALFFERGVMHGTLGLIPVYEDDERHVHDESSARHRHTHLKVRAAF